MKQLKIIILCFLAGGCAFTDAKLNINYEKPDQGPLSSIEPLSINIRNLVDQRPDKAIIGHKINGIGMDTADIMAQKPVSEIVKAALTAMFEKNGHHITSSGAHVIIDGEIKEFWLKLQMNVMTIEFLGTMVLSLTVKDVNQKTIYTREYQGHYDEKKAAGYTKTWEKVMNITLEKLMYQIATDQELIKVLAAQTLSDIGDGVAA